MNEEAVKSAVDRIFSPEFRNRIDAIVRFNALTGDNILSIVKKAVDEFNIQLAEKNVSLEVSEEAYQWFANRGYSPEFGAREIARLIQDELKEFFVDEILFGSLSEGGTARVEVENDGIKINVGDSLKN